MAKVVPDDQNRFRRTWNTAREQGVSRQVMADSLGLDRGRMNDLILGRAKPTLGEMSTLSGRRRSTLVAYNDTAGSKHSFYTGRGMSFESLIASGAIVDIADEMGEVNHYDDFDHVAGLANRSPQKPAQTRIYATGRTLRNQAGGMQRYTKDAS